MSKKQLAEAKEQLPANVDFEADEGSGFEETDVDAFAVPFVAILQKMSPQCDDDSPNRVEEAKPGQLFNTVTEEIIEGRSEQEFAGITVIPCAFKRQYIEWAPRETGGGLVAIHTVDEGKRLLQQCSKNDKGADITPEGNVLSDTRMHYVLMHTGERGWEPVIISMSSTQIKKSRKWMTNMDNIKFTRRDGSKYTPAMFAHVWKLTTVPEENAKGNWRGWKIEKLGVVEDAATYSAARDFRDMVVNDEVKPAQPVAEEPVEM